MTVVGNDGSIKTLTKLYGYDKDDALLYYNKLVTQKYKRNRNNGTRAMKELLKNCDKIRLSYKSGIVHEQQPVTHEELENGMRTAKELESIVISTSKFDSENGMKMQMSCRRLF